MSFGWPVSNSPFIFLLSLPLGALPVSQSPLGSQSRGSTEHQNRYQETSQPNFGRKLDGASRAGRLLTEGILTIKKKQGEKKRDQTKFGHRNTVKREHSIPYISLLLIASRSQRISGPELQAELSAWYSLYALCTPGCAWILMYFVVRHIYEVLCLYKLCNFLVWRRRAAERQCQDFAKRYS